MAEMDGLANLRDIHLPKAISWWPLAPGWYVLGVLLLALIASAIWMLRRHYQHAYPKRQALLLLASYEREWQHHRQGALACAQVSELLRRVALAYFPRDTVAGLQGEPWLIFLNQQSNAIDFIALRDYVLIFPYQQDGQAINPTMFFNSARAWIKQRGKPCLN